MLGTTARLPGHRAAVALLLVCGTAVLACGDAQAHGAIKGINDFHAGMIHPVTELIHVLPIFVLGMLLGQHGIARTEPALWLFPLALAVGGALALAVPALPSVDAINVFSLILLGVLVASARQLPATILMSLVVAFGVTHGYGNGTALTVDMRKLMFLSGMILSGFFVMVYGLIITASLLSKGPAWFAIVVRVLGSWGAAIGLLVLAVTRKALFP